MTASKTSYSACRDPVGYQNSGPPRQCADLQAEPNSAPHTPVTCSERGWAVPDVGTGPAPRLVAVSNRLPVEGLEVELGPLELDRPTLGGYYYGFSNRTLWPLLHGLVEQSLFERRWWDAYISANERFAAAALDQVGRRGDALLWVHD